METVMLSPRDRKFLLAATQVVEEHLSEREFNVTALAMYLGKSRVTVHRMLRKILDQSASEFIRDVRLDHATRILDKGECSVRQAATEAGFYNASYFSKCFRVRFGCKPSEFIRRRAQDAGRRA